MPRRFTLIYQTVLMALLLQASCGNDEIADAHEKSKEALVSIKNIPPAVLPVIEEEAVAIVEPLPPMPTLLPVYSGGGNRRRGERHKPAPMCGDGTIDSNEQCDLGDETACGSGEICVDCQCITAVADLAMVKTADDTDVIILQTLTYTLTVTNNGPNAADNVVVTDTLPEGVTFYYTDDVECEHSEGTITCSLSSLANGESKAFNIVVSIDASARGDLVNYANVTSDALDPDGDNNSASISNTVDYSADLQITKTASPNPVNVGDTITYTLAIKNLGPNNTSAVVVNDYLPSGVTLDEESLPEGCSYENYAVICTVPETFFYGEEKSFEFNVTVDAGQEGNTIENTATVSSAEDDPNPDNDSSTATTTVNQVPQADITIHKTVSNANPETGATITYTLEIQNLSLENVSTNITVVDFFPDGLSIQSVSSDTFTCANSTEPITCFLFSLAPSAQAFIYITATVTAEPSTTLDNGASVDSSNDSDDSNNFSSAGITVQQPGI